MKNIYTLVFVTLLCFNSAFSKIYPTSTIVTLNNPSPGVTFVGSSLIEASIYDNYGKVTTPNKWANLSNGSDFKLHKNGKISYFSQNLKAFVILDKNLNVLDTFKSTKGNVTDFHDIQIKDDGTVLLYNSYTKTINMSQKVTGGSENAVVYGHTIQEIDKNKNVIWEWDTFDKLDVTEANTKLDLTTNAIDYVHINSLIYDTDGNIIISCRTFDEIIKVNRSTGAIMWRLGGKFSKNNQFTFVNDTDQYGNWGFSAQHTPVRMANGNLLLFDNGNLKEGLIKYSRAVEYKLDEVNKIATKVWEFRMMPDMYISFMGSVQELFNGNIYISFGKEQVEVTKDKEILFHMRFTQDNPTYRGYKFIYDMDYRIINVNNIGLYDFNNQTNNTNIQMRIDTLTGTGDVTVMRYPYTAHDAVFLDVPTPLKVMPVRYVIQKAKSITNLKYQVTIDTKNISGFFPEDSIYIFYRPKETVGGFVKITTNYVPEIKSLVANLPGDGEIVLASTVPLGKVELDLPKNNSTGLQINTNLAWKRLLDTRKYQINVSKDSTFRNLLLDSIINTASLTYVSINGLENFTNYYWRVRGMNDTNIGEWSDTFKFRTIIAEPTLKNPENNAYYVNTSGNMEWSKVAGALKYRIQVSTTSYFLDNLVDVEVTNSNQYSYKNYETNKTYYWRVMSIRDNESSSFSNYLKFTTKLNSPLLRFPANEAKFIPTDFKFVWFNVAGAVKYFYEIYTDSLNPKSLVLRDTNLTTNEINITNLKTYQKYYWRVKAVNLQNYSNWSDFNTFETKIANPLQLLPTNGSKGINYSVKLEWKQNPGSGFEKLQLFKTDDETNINDETLVLDTIATFNFITITNLDFSANYFWRIKSVSENGESDWSELWSFGTREANKLTVPSLVLPQNDVTFGRNEVEFNWFSQNSLNYKYRIQISDNNNFQNFYIDTIVDVDRVTFKLPNMSLDYYWRVKSVYNNLESDWSRLRYFSVSLTSYELPITVLIAPENNLLIKKEDIKFKWNFDNENNTLNVNGYRLVVAEDIDFDFIVADINDIINSEYILDDEILIENKRYFWKVQAVVNGEQTLWSEVFTFTVDKTILSVEKEIINSNNLINIYPNPSSEFIALKIETTENLNADDLTRLSNFDISIFDINSKLILEKRNVNINQLINIKDLQSGTYYIIANENQGNLLFKQKFVKTE